ncbi:MAG TPA: sn-glycerol-3-phosphate ABC transporter ATP-binding protein UgpC [Dongiaceae bacterium]|jgi:multiple sugar transport system ATP-binding protein|nr:sn-glycerol-3-phosphate ABC transporter ATP-binding protein UgpC [Dongiaceae bacterium]
MAAIELQKLTKNFGQTQVIRGVDLVIDSHEFVVFVGPSGCGKSTLLRLIAGLEDISSGDMLIDGEVVNHRVPAERGVAIVFQSYALYPHMNVYDNMAFGLKVARRSHGEIAARVREAARLLKIDHLLERKPRELSGGQRQRVAIGRAIVREPRIFLFDEPLSNLDAALRTEMRVEIAKLHRRLDATMIYVTHDQHEAMTLADRIVVLDQGRIRQVGTPLELYRDPVDQFVAGFIGSPRMNFLNAAITRAGRSTEIGLAGNGQVDKILLPFQSLAIGDVTLGIRPEGLTIGGRGDLKGKVITVERLGSESFVYADVGSEAPVVAKLAGDIALPADGEITLTLDPDCCYLFDRDGMALPRSRREQAAPLPVAGQT